MPKKKKIGLVLTGGGARGAYQAGALKAIIEISSGLGISSPFPVLVGTSAGAINAAYLAAHAENLSDSVKLLGEKWLNIRSSDVYKIDPISLAITGMRWASELIAGGLFSQKKAAQNCAAFVGVIIYYTVTVVFCVSP